MNPGSLLIRLAALSAVAACVFAFRWMRGHAPSERLFRVSYHTLTGSLAVASVLLMQAILNHEFRYEYVAGYSSRDLPLLYLVSAFWGGQEGTYLLWALFGALLGYPLFRRTAWQPAAVMAAYIPTLVVLIALMLDRGGDPFRVTAGEVPADGRGLNPLLQDPWMAAHPPIVFLGYAAVTIPGAFAWVAALRREESRWLSSALRYALFGFVTLGVGIVMGGFWAYKVLGWGGFWGWDPVENASLVPWLFVTALIHGLIVQMMTGSLRLTNLILAMSGYLTVIYATFLTRSGVLADFSVHSFPKGTVYRWLLIAMIAALAFCILVLLKRSRARTPLLDTRLAWPVILTLVLGLFSVSAIFVTLGTSWPILSSWFGKPATPTAGFYNQINLPLYVVLLTLLSLAPFLTWLPIAPARWVRKVIPSVAVALLGTMLAIILGARGAVPILLFFLGLAVVTSNAIRLYNVARQRLWNTGAAIAHIGFGMMFLGIIASECWDRSERLQLALGEPTNVLGRTITFKGHVAGSEPKDLWALDVASGTGSSREERVTYYQREQGDYFKKPSILRGVGGDFYLAPEAVESAHGDHALELYKNQAHQLGDFSFTFLRFDMGSGEHEEMKMAAVVRVVCDGNDVEMSLPLSFYGGKMQGTPVPMPFEPEKTLTLLGMSVEQGMIRVSAGEGEADTAPVMLLEASVKPLIWVLWVGTTLLCLGCVIAFVRRSLDRATDEQAALLRAEGVKAARKPAAPQPERTGATAG